MKLARFQTEMGKLFRLAFVQKAIVLLLRATWVGGAVYIFCWGSNQFWGWFPQERWWVIYAAITSLIILGSMLRYTRLSKAFVWRVDRTFELEQQVFTAYERINLLGEYAENDAGTQLLLGSDAVGSLPKIRRRMAVRFGRIRREIESNIVVLILLLIIYVAGIGSFDWPPFSIGLGFLPSVPAEPQAGDIFRSGIPGDESQPEGKKEEQQESEPDLADFDFKPICDPAMLMNQAAWQQTQEQLTQLGDRLCCGSATLVLSEALKYQDYPTASDQFSVMAGKISEYSDQTRQLLADEFQETSLSLRQIGQEEGAVEFSKSASALQGGSRVEMAESLDNLAGLMRQYDAQQRCMTLAFWEPGVQLLPSPVTVDAESLQIFSASVDFLGPESQMIESESDFAGTEGGLPSYKVPLDDTDVVSSYFSPE